MMRNIVIVTSVVLLLSQQHVVNADTLLHVASGIDTVSTFAAWMADLSSLYNDTTVVVLAPTNRAMEETIERRIARNLATAPEAWTAHVTDLLQSHMVAGASLKEGEVSENVTTLSGQVVVVETNDAGVTVNGIPVDEGAEADDGVLHVLEEGIIAPAWLEQTLPDAVSDVDKLSTFVSLLEQANVMRDISRNGPFTVWAPTNAAFAAWGEHATACVTSDPDLLEATLYYHVWETLVPAALLETANVTTMEGSDVAVTNATLQLNSKSNITTPDAILANNGIVHLIDTVLIPPSITDAVDTCVDARLTLPEKAAALDSSNNVSTFVSLVLSDSDVETKLNEEGPFTIFAPTDVAFAKLSAESAACIADDEAIRSAVLLFHVQNGTVETTDESIVLDDSVLDRMTMNMTALMMTMHDDNSTTLLMANITTMNAVIASNGVLHTIDTVMVPTTVSNQLEACVAAAEAERDTTDATSASAVTFWSVSLAALVVVMSAI